jgi:hypothetical protein
MVVDNVRDPDLKATIQTGDSIVSINEEAIDYSVDVIFTDIVERLASEPRPLTLTFSRTINQNEMQIESMPGTSERSDSSSFRGRSSIYKLDVSLAAGVLTLMEKDVPLFRGSISTSKLSCNFSHFKDTKITARFSTSLGIDYYNLSIWGWEPFLEPGVVFLSTSFHDAEKGPRELSIEIGDNSNVLSFNLTDSLVGTMSKLLSWMEEQSECFESDEMILSDFIADSNKSAINGSTDLASRKAANAALRFATRQRNDTAKPFIFRNKCGLTVAFVQHSRGSDEPTRPMSRLRSFEGLGDFTGLHSSESSEIMVVANDEELKFRVEVTPSAGARGDQPNVADISYCFPSLTVAIQETHDAVTDAFENLQIARPCETLLPLTFSRRMEGGNRVEYLDRKWVTWQVEQIDERTVLTFGSSIRVCSMLDRSLELSVEFGDFERNVRNDSPHHSISIGSVRSGEPFHLPLWLAMHKDRWRCNVRLHGGYRFTPLFQVSATGNITLYQKRANCIECVSLSGDIPSAWLAITMQGHDVSMITIDCSLCVRNMLPSDIEWEVGLEDSAGIVAIDGSTVRKHSFGVISTLKSGEQAEILSTLNENMKIRLQPAGFSAWSAWYSIAIFGIERLKRPIESDQNTEKETEVTVLIFVKDSFGISLPLGIRMAQKVCGIDVTFYADIWCTNCTQLQVVFGCPMKQLTKNIEEKTSEISTAEATLKEISSLFESGEGGAGFGQTDDRFRDPRNDFVRLPGQVSSCIVEECFEYLEVHESNVIRHWWATENPFMPKENWTALEESAGHINWIDKAWVSLKVCSERVVMLNKLTSAVSLNSISTSQDPLLTVGNRALTISDSHQKECLILVIVIGDVGGSVEDMVSTGLL